MRSFKFLLIMLALFAIITGANAAAVKVLTMGSNGSHMPSFASINNDIINTVATSLSGINLNDYDVLYFHEHPFSFTSSDFSAIRSAVNSGVGLVAEYTPIANLNNIFNSSIAVTGTGTTLSNTTEGASHSTVTGVGLQNGQVISDVNATLNNQSRNSSIDALGCHPLIKDSNNNYFTVTGTYGAERVFLIGTEVLEGGYTTSEAHYAHNAIQFAATAIPEPATLSMFAVVGICLLFSRKLRLS